MPKTIVLVATLDTKGAEARYLKKQIEKHGVRTLVMDIGILGQPLCQADVTRQQVVQASGMDLQAAIVAGDRQKAVTIMIEGASRTARKLYAAGQLDGIIAIGGGTALFMGTAIMRALPIGVPSWYSPRWWPGT